MASSFSSQIPVIINLIRKLNPQKVLDIGKGFGKYGLLIHEYLGIPTNKKTNPMLTLQQQSKIVIDAVEVEEDLMLSYLNQIYREIFLGDIFDLYKGLYNYDLILMLDVIEHLDKEKTKKMLKYFLEKGCTIIIATPREFFEQHLYESKYEEHISHWTAKDFQDIGEVDFQNASGGIVYLLSSQEIDVMGFGHSLKKRFKR